MMGTGRESVTPITGTETMDESLTERRRVYDEGLRIVKYCR